MKKIYINPGHSDTDPGAVGFEQERRLNVAVCEHMRAHLQKNFDVQIRMNPGSMGGLYDICNDANSWGADLFVSNHFNAAGGDGYEALVYAENRRGLGQVFEKHVKAVGQNSRGVKLRPGLVVLRDTNMPAVLNEGAFVDNQKDIQDWNEDHELKKLGIAYAKAAAEYLGLAEKAPAVTVQVTLQELRLGSTGEQVKALQRLLAAMGHYKSTVDGDFGDLTDGAVRAYQAAQSLTQDGIVGSITWGRLLGL